MLGSCLRRKRSRPARSISPSSSSCPTGGLRGRTAARPVYEPPPPGHGAVRNAHHPRGVPHRSRLVAPFGLPVGHDGPSRRGRPPATRAHARRRAGSSAPTLTPEYEEPPPRAGRSSADYYGIAQRRVLYNASSSLPRLKEPSPAPGAWLGPAAYSPLMPCVTILNVAAAAGA